jgi:hemerythrin-like domain-containing protein
MNSMKTTTFSSLSKEHAELERLFNRHQRSLLARNIDKAVSVLRTFEGELNRHIDFEEQRLLRLYADLGAETPGGTLQIFQAEHAKLRDSVAKLARRTEELSASNDLTGAILVLLDEETAFKGLFHHHASREQNLLFPRLDDRTTDEEREMWLSHD